MKASCVYLPAASAALLWLGSGGAARADTVNARCDIYAKGTDNAARVMACTFSQRQGHVAIDRADGRRHEFSPRGSAGNYIDETGQKAFRSQGLGSKGQIYRLARETIYVYWDTAGLPGEAQAMPAPARLLTWPAAAAPPVPFEQTLKLQGISFHVTSDNRGPRNELKIVPGGLSIDNAPIVRAIEGQIIGAEVADLNVDGSPEVYVYIRSGGSGRFGSLVAFSANQRKSLSEIHLPPLSDDPRSAQGYRGHDDFAVVESTLARRFPVYKDGDHAASPSGGVRQLHYKLKPGESNWQLQLERVDGY